MLRYGIRPHTCGSGLMIFHTGDFIHVGDFVKIGTNCTLLPGVGFSTKTINDRIKVGDNCRLGLGVRIFGNVTIGNNVIVGSNSVVTKDFPDNCVIAGVLAKIIKSKEC